jgi:hypothetical protein
MYHKKNINNPIQPKINTKSGKTLGKMEKRTQKLTKQEKRWN